MPRGLCLQPTQGWEELESQAGVGMLPARLGHMGA